MKIKCYYPINPYEDQHRWCANVIFRELFKSLKTTYTNINFELIDSLAHSEQMGIHHNGHPGQKFGYHRMIIENAKTKKYFVVNYYDTLQSIYPGNNWDTENLVEIFSSTGAHQDNLFYKSNNIIYTPISYCCRQVADEEYLIKEENNISNTTNLIFRGNLYLFRKFLKNDIRFKIFNTLNNKLPERQYLKELQDNFISLSLNGTGEICHRDIESFGAFSTVIRPELTVRFHNSLIPNFHYITIKIDDLYNLDTPTYYSTLANRIYEKYIEIKDNKELLNFISCNARKWFLENGTIQANVKILTELINFQKLK